MAESALRLVPSPRPSEDPYDRIRAALHPTFLAPVISVTPKDLALWGRRCAISGCDGWYCHGKPPLCAQHRKRLHNRRASRSLTERDPLPTSTFLADAACNGGPVANDHPGFDMTGLPYQLELELRLLVQTRWQQQRTFYRHQEHQRIRRVALDAGLDTLLLTPGRTDDEWLSTTLVPEAFLGDSQQVLAHVRFAVSAAREVAWPVPVLERDRWYQHDFGATGQRTKTITWIGYRHPWLKAWLKRWSAYRLAAGATWATAVSYAGRLLHFDRFLAAEHPEVGGPQDLSRELLLEYAAWTQRQPGIAGSQRQGLVSAVRVLLEDHRLNGWQPAIPERAVIRSGELPRRDELLPRPIPEHLLRQLLCDANLRSARPDLATMLIILDRHGFRVGTLVRLSIDCLGEDADGYPTLRYLNHKRHRERLHPVRDPLVVPMIQEQRRRARSEHPTTPWLFPALRSNPTGEHHTTETALRTAFYEYQQRIGLQDEDGRAVRVTLHQFRHTFGTRELNNGARQEVVQELLDHDDPAVTRIYARLTNAMLRKEFLSAVRVNADGEILTGLAPDSPLADVAWMREQLNRARVTLPNGYCALPVQQTCEAQNACLDCKGYFVTTPEFLPAHQAQRAHTIEMIEVAEAQGHKRLAERNRTVLVMLDTLIASLEAAR